MRKFAVLLVIMTFLAGCGGGKRNPAGPEIDPNTVVVKDLETGTLVFDADVHVNGSIVEAHKSGYRNRRTKTAAEITMFPTGPDFDELFLDQLLFNEFVPNGLLSRPKGPVYVVLTSTARKLTRSAVEAAAHATGLSGGRILFYVVSAVDGEVPAGEVVCKISVRDVPDGFLGYASNEFDVKTGYIVSSEVVIDPEFLNETAKHWQYLGHEFGHVMGLGHPEQFGLMNSSKTLLQNKDFSEAEKRATRLACLRPVGTASPDDDSAIPYKGNEGVSFSFGVGFKKDKKSGTTKVDILCTH